jgi:hypothetical protein
MKILLDENIPHDFRHVLKGHDVFTVAYMGWDSIGNGQLLALAAGGGFDVVITKDAGVEYEQNQDRLPLSVVVLQARTNRMDDLMPLVPTLLGVLGSLGKGVLRHVR